MVAARPVCLVCTGPVKGLTAESTMGGFPKYFFLSRAQFRLQVKVIDDIFSLADDLAMLSQYSPTLSPKEAFR